MQPDLWDSSSMEERHEDWIEVAVKVVETVALRRPELTTNDVWAGLQDDPTERRAIGPVMRVAQKRGLIFGTGHHIPVGSHGRPLRVWKSLIYRDEAA